MTTKRYPSCAGFKTSDGASDRAARIVEADPDRLVRALTQIALITLITLNAPLNRDEIADLIGEPPMYTRPRTTDLINWGVIAKGLLKPGSSLHGRSARTLIPTGDLEQHVVEADPKSEDDLRIAVRSLVVRRKLEAEQQTQQNRTGETRQTGGNHA